MTKIIRIARLELSTLFFSPIAWFLLIVFLFQCGYVYCSIMGHYVKMIELGGANLKYLGFLTQSVFASEQGFLQTVISSLYLYIPLLTMGLISREVSSGTIKLLYSSPVKIPEIVWGKFIAMMLYNLLLVSVLFIFVLTGIFNIKSADTGMLLSGLSGIYLLLCAYSAIGLFMSCLTSYQVVAAISTYVVLGLLAYVGNIWQGTDFLRDVTYFLRISGRVDQMISGLLTTKDVLYFVIIIGLFLGLSIIKLEGSRESGPWYIRTARYGLVVVVVLTAGYITSLPRLIGYWDTTATQTNTLSVQTQKIVRGLNGPLEVTSYINLLDHTFGRGAPVQRNADLARWESYMRFKPDIKLKYVYYYDSTQDKNVYRSNQGKTLRQIAEKYAKSADVDLADFKSPAEIRQLADLRGEGGRYVMQLKYGGKETFLRLFDDLFVFPSETEVAAALKRLTDTLPKIAFLSGQFERNIHKMGDRDYGVLTSEKNFRYALVNQGFDVRDISLDSLPGQVAAELPADLTALVIADPRVPFSPSVTSAVQKYIARGGNLLIAGEPGKQSLLNPLLRPLGVSLMNGQLIDTGNDLSPDLILSRMTVTAASFSNGLRRAYEDSVRVSLPGAVGISGRDSSGYTIMPLLLTDSLHSWNRQSPWTADSLTLVYHPHEGDERGPIPTALALSRPWNGREQRIVVLGDADVMSNAELSRRNVKTDNFRFVTALFGWFTYGQFPVDTSRPHSKDNSLTISAAGLSFLKLLFLWILPEALFLFCIILLIRRKRK